MKKKFFTINLSTKHEKKNEPKSINIDGKTIWNKKNVQLDDRKILIGIDGESTTIMYKISQNR